MAISFTGSVFTAILNPVGYFAQHVSVDKAAQDYAAGHPPAAGIDLNKVTEVSFKEDRQHYIDACAGALKARDAGYSKANCNSNCAGQFDQSPITEAVKNAIAQRANSEKAAIQASTAKNVKVIIAIIAAALIIGLLLFLFLS